MQMERVFRTISRQIIQGWREGERCMGGRLVTLTPGRLRWCRREMSVLSPLPPSQSDSSHGHGHGHGQGQPERTAEELEEDEREGKRQEEKYRTYKKLFSTFLFGTTFGLAMYGRRLKNARVAENLKDCVGLPSDENFTGGHKDFFLCRNPSSPNSGGCVLPAQILKDGTIRAVKTLPVRPTDVFVASFPKSGTTWLQEIVYLIQHDLNFEKAKEEVMEVRSPYLEYPYPGLSTVNAMPSPRIIKTHLPYDLLPEDIGKAKVIYIMRNPKDTAVSYYYFARMLAFSSYQGTMAQFIDKFKNNELPYTPYFGHLDSYVEREDDPSASVLVIKYEDLSKDPASVIHRIGVFLERGLSKEDVECLVTHTSFKRMAENPSVNYSHWDSLGLRNEKEARFLRKGQVGDWENDWTESMNKSFDDWVKRNNKRGHGFDYHI